MHLYLDPNLDPIDDDAVKEITKDSVVRVAGVNPEYLRGTALVVSIFGKKAMLSFGDDGPLVELSLDRLELVGQQASLFSDSAIGGGTGDWTAPRIGQQAPLFSDSAMLAPPTAVDAEIVPATQGELLSATERAALGSLEGIVERGLSNFVEVGKALAQIRDNKLYRATSETFEGYCQQRFDLSRRYADYQIASAEVVEDLRTRVLILPATEKQARPLLALPPEKRAQVWQSILDENPGQITAAFVQERVRALQPPRQKQLPATKSEPQPELPMELQEIAASVLGENYATLSSDADVVYCLQSSAVLWIRSGDLGTALMSLRLTWLRRVLIFSETADSAYFGFLATSLFAVVPLGFPTRHWFAWCWSAQPGEIDRGFVQAFGELTGEIWVPGDAQEMLDELSEDAP
jgi:hypothetical protein